MRSNRSNEGTQEPRPLESVSTGELLSRFFKQITELLKKELDLAKSEIRTSIRSVVSVAVEFAAAIVFGLLGLMLMSAAAVLGLATMMPAWLAALLVGFVMLAIAFGFAQAAKGKGIKKPLDRTQKTLKEDVKWAKERMA